jgi:hypothetical protein
MDTVFGYLLDDPNSGHLAKFPLVAGSSWTGRGGGGEQEGVERMIHRELLGALAPKLPSYVDQLMLPEEDDCMLRNISTLLYSGRY